MHAAWNAFKVAENKTFCLNAQNSLLSLAWFMKSFTNSLVTYCFIILHFIRFHCQGFALPEKKKSFIICNNVANNWSFSRPVMISMCSYGEMHLWNAPLNAGQLKYDSHSTCLQIWEWRNPVMRVIVLDLNINGRYVDKVNFDEYVSRFTITDYKMRHIWRFFLKTCTWKWVGQSRDS